MQTVLKLRSTRILGNQIHKFTLQILWFLLKVYSAFGYFNLNYIKLVRHCIKYHIEVLIDTIKIFSLELVLESSLEFMRYLCVTSIYFFLLVFLSWVAWIFESSINKYYHSKVRQNIHVQKVQPTLPCERVWHQAWPRNASEMDKQ